MLLAEKVTHPNLHRALTFPGSRRNLLSLRKRRFTVTTDSNHKVDVYLNLARRMKLSGMDQLWVADNTSIRLKAECVYREVILDAFSQKVVGWALDRSPGNGLTISASERAIARRWPTTWSGSPLGPRTAIRPWRVCGCLGKVSGQLPVWVVQRILVITPAARVL